MGDTGRQLALITGGSDGIGYELARQCAMHGHDVIIAADGRRKLEDARARLAQEFPDAAFEAVAVDLATGEGVEELHSYLDGRQLDTLAANAGAGLVGDFAVTDLRDELRLINLDVVGQVHLIKLVLRDMLEHGGGGRILITSSIVGLTPNPLFAIYAASKAFMRSFGLALRDEVKENGVSVTILMPNATDTNFFEAGDMEHTPAAQGPKDDPEFVAREAFEALMKESAQIVPGIKNKMMAASMQMAPATAAAATAKKQIRS